MHQERKFRFAFRLAFLLFLCFLFGPSVEAQEVRDIRGVVHNEANQPLTGTNIAVKNGTTWVLTGREGSYSLRARAVDTIVFSHVGYETAERIVGDASVINVVLREKVTELSSVVVTALGIKRQAQSLTYSTHQLSGKEITAVQDPGGNIMNSLSGKVANMVVTPAASGPGGAARVILRGNRSINGNNNALIVVDGVPIDNSMSWEPNGGGSANTLGTQSKGIGSSYAGMDGASSVNPEDVETITVLKGPAAAALYGSRAANGALIITTKSGKTGKTSINYNGGVSVDLPYFLNTFQNEYGAGNGGAAGTNAAQSWGAKTKTYPDNVKSFYRDGFLANNYIDVSGGTEKMRAFASYAHNNTNGIVPKNSMTRDNFNVRVSGRILPRLSMDAKITYLNQSIDHLPRLGDQGIHNEAYIMPRDLSVDALKNFEKTDPATGQPIPVYWANSSIFQNPYWDVYRMNVTENRDRILLLGSLKYELTDWLNVQARYSLDKDDDLLTGAYFNGTVLAPFNPPGGRYQESAIRRWERNVDFLFSGNNKIADNLSVSYNLGGAILDQRGGSKSTLANGLNVINKFSFDFASALSATTVPFKKEIQSLYGNVLFNFKDYLYLDGSLRNDWSSTLPAPYSYSYPSVGLAAVISEMTKLPLWISFGKIRVAYTNVGNDADPYRTTQLYLYSAGAGSGFISRDATKSVTGLKPEKTKSMEAGIEWRFFNNRLGLDATFYKTNTVNQLVLIGLPAASGFSNQYVNVGDIRNAGFEAHLSAIPISTPVFKWTSNINFALNRNKIISLKEGITSTVLAASTNFGQLIIAPGGSYGDIYGYGWAKDATTGKYLITATGLPVATPARDQKLGNFNPDYTVGWNNSLSYKRFNLGFQVDGRVGGIIMSGTDAIMAYYGVSDYTTKFRDGGLVLDGVLADGSNNTTAINAEKLWTTLSAGGRNTGYDQFFAFDATNFRLRELSVGYTFKLNPGFVKDVRLSLSGRNLLFLYRGKSKLDIPGIGRRTLPVDPESAIGTSNYQGIESGLPPAVRSIGINLHVSI